MKEDCRLPPAGVEVVKTNSTLQWMGLDGVLRVICLPGAVMDLQEAKTNVATYPDVEKRFPVLIDVREIRSLTREAREFYRGPENDRINAAAIVVGSPLSRMIGNFFVGLSKMSVDHKLFSDETEAINWLRGFVR